MKTKQAFRLVSASLLMAVVFVGNLAAQTTHATALPSTAAQTVNINSTYHYGIDSVERAGVSNIYTWTVTGVPAPVAGTHYVISPAAATNNSQKTIKWLVAGAYIVHLSEANPVANGGCSVTHGTIAVTVNAVPTGTVQFASLTGTNQCSAAASTAYTTNLTNTGTISYPVTITYSITKNGATTTGYTVSVAAPGTSVTFPASDAFTSSLADDTGRKITITGVTDSFGGTLTIGANATHTLTIWALPVISTIHHD
jgi:hypothetical protein